MAGGGARGRRAGARPRWRRARLAERLSAVGRGRTGRARPLSRGGARAPRGAAHAALPGAWQCSGQGVALKPSAAAASARRAGRGGAGRPAGGQGAARAEGRGAGRTGHARAVSISTVKGRNSVNRDRLRSAAGPAGGARAAQRQAPRRGRVREAQAPREARRARRLCVSGGRQGIGALETARDSSCQLCMHNTYGMPGVVPGPRIGLGFPFQHWNFQHCDRLGDRQHTCRRRGAASRGPPRRASLCAGELAGTRARTRRRSGSANRVAVTRAARGAACSRCCRSRRQNRPTIRKTTRSRRSSRRRRPRRRC